MASLNKFIGIGNTTRDPETTFGANGSAVCKITIAINEKWRDKQGENKERVEYVRVVSFGTQAETIQKYVTKGTQLYVEGRLQTSSYEKEGVTRYTTDIIMSSFQFLGSKKQDGHGNQEHQQPQQQQGYQNASGGGYQQPQSNQQGKFVGSPPDGSDVPF